MNLGSDICKEAIELINGDRRQAYGDYKDEATRIAKMWSGICGFDIKTEHVPLMMVALKLRRHAQNYKRDNLVDAIGYILLSEQLNEKS